MQNRLRESLNLFREVWKNRFLRGVSVILFLNKMDLLEEKFAVRGAGARLKQNFPEYSGACLPACACAYVCMYACVRVRVHTIRRNCRK